MICFNFVFGILIALSYVREGSAVQCYQCSSAEDGEGEDNCGAYKRFNKDRHIAAECSSDESVTSGTFCMKITQQGPRGFIWDGRWRQVIRRCASVAETGVTGVCNWGVMENGVYWEECYCSGDGCNTGSFLTFSPLLVLLSLVLGLSKIVCSGSN